MKSTLNFQAELLNFLNTRIGHGSCFWGLLHSIKTFIIRSFVPTNTAFNPAFAINCISSSSSARFIDTSRIQVERIFSFLHPIDYCGQDFFFQFTFIYQWNYHQQKRQDSSSLYSKVVNSSITCSWFLCAVFFHKELLYHKSHNQKDSLVSTEDSSKYNFLLTYPSGQRSGCNIATHLKYIYVLHFPFSRSPKNSGRVISASLRTRWSTFS